MGTPRGDICSSLLNLLRVFDLTMRMRTLPSIKSYEVMVAIPILVCEGVATWLIRRCNRVTKQRKTDLFTKPKVALSICGFLLLAVHPYLLYPRRYQGIHEESHFDTDPRVSNI
jgi:hypothetical protein